jgi:hypothetical protein
MSRSIRVALLSAVVLASPMLSFAGGQPPVSRTPSKSEAQDRTGISRAVQQGKGTGMTRVQGVQANASRSQTASETQVAKDQSRAGSPNWSDPAYRK